MTKYYFLVAVLGFCPLNAARGDLNQYMLRTTEWLVDHSQVICVVEFEGEDSDSVARVLRTIKGNAEAVQWPLKRMDHDGYPYFGPPPHGLVRLLFIGENNELWQSVQLGRSPLESPTLSEAFYGVGQYGQVYLTESSLVDAIGAQLRAARSRPVTRRRTSTHFERSGIEAPQSFPFENGGETFVLIVDFNERRRDYFLTQLTEGDCAERVHAIKELSQLHDTQAMTAIRAATAATDVEPSHAFSWSDRSVHSQADEVVRAAARDALTRLQRAP